MQCPLQVPLSFKLGGILVKTMNDLNKRENFSQSSLSIATKLDTVEAIINWLLFVVAPLPVRGDS